MPTALGLHLICVALVATDLVARSWRTQILVHGVGHGLGFRRSFAINAFGDAAATLTPLRVAGQPARVLALVHDGVPLDATVVAVGVEAVITYATVAACAVVLMVAAAPDWWGTMRGVTATAGGVPWPWLLLAGVLSAALLLAGRRRSLRTRATATTAATPSDGGAAGSVDTAPRPFQRLRAMWALVRLVPLRAQLLAIPLSIVNVVTRVAILPVLAQAFVAPPGWTALWLGSFALLYGQLVVPTPAGAGVVDAGFLAGAAAVGDTEAGRALFWWRLYTSVVGLVLGLLLGGPRYGLRPVLRAVRGGLRRAKVADEAQR
ncbi:MAG: lysylphosphatidylglycerol synthase transmembrane domain-containing protein [Gemmatimonadaceae bacterium]